MNMAMRKTEDMLGSFVREQKRLMNAPMPLKGVSYDVEFLSALAVVTQKRVFKNEEKNPIEATMTFPVAYDAVVTSVKAVVAGRTLVGVAKAKKQARETYEKALDDGKAAVLHEELLRGLHMVSVGNVAPGAEIVVETVSVAPMRIVSGKGRVRIPLTVGAVYGSSPFLPSDDLVNGGDVFDAAISVNGAPDVTVNGLPSANVASVKTSHVIDIEVADPVLAPLTAKTAKDGHVTLEFAAAAPGVAPLAANLLLDASGSMNEPASEGKTKWTAMCDGLSVAFKGGEIREDDTFAFFSFSDDTVSGGKAKGRAAGENVRKLPMQGRGTRIGQAVETVAKAEANVLLITDGRSHDAIDFDLVKKSGCRFTVVLVGGASLEARVAQLAAISGGQLFIVPSTGDVAGTVAAAFASMRSAASAAHVRTSRTEGHSRTVSGLVISVGYSDAPAISATEHPAAAGYAAWLGVQTLEEDEAAKLAEEEGIVTHLTSIVLVDQEGETVDGVAVNRKIGLSDSDEGFDSASTMSFAMHFMDSPAPMQASRAYHSAPLRGSKSLMASGSAPGGGMGGLERLVAMAGERQPYIDNSKPLPPITPLPITRGMVPASVNWNAVAEAVNDGKAPSALGMLVTALSGRHSIAALATKLGEPEWKVVVAVVALKIGRDDRTAQRLARKILGVFIEGDLIKAALKELPA